MGGELVWIGDTPALQHFISARMNEENHVRLSRRNQDQLGNSGLSAIDHIWLGSLMSHSTVSKELNHKTI
jgi:hypothetical protein